MNGLYTARYVDYLVSLAGACLVAFGLGIVVGDSLGNLGWIAILVGGVVHGYGMCKIHSRKVTAVNG